MPMVRVVGDGMEPTIMNTKEALRRAYDEGGYEARSSNYKPGVAEALIKGGKELLGDMQGIG